MPHTEIGVNCWGAVNYGLLPKHVRRQVYPRMGRLHPGFEHTGAFAGRQAQARAEADGRVAGAAEAGGRAAGAREADGRAAGAGEADGRAAGTCTDTGTGA